MKFSNEEVKKDLKKYFYDCKIDDMLEMAEIQGITLQRFIEKTIISEVNKIKDGRYFAQRRLNDINETLIKYYEMVYEFDEEIEDWQRESNLMILEKFKEQRKTFLNILDKLGDDTNE